MKWFSLTFKTRCESMEEGRQSQALFLLHRRFLKGLNAFNRESLELQLTSKMSWDLKIWILANTIPQSLMKIRIMTWRISWTPKVVNLILEIYRRLNKDMEVKVLPKCQVTPICPKLKPRWWTTTMAASQETKFDLKIKTVLQISWENNKKLKLTTPFWSLQITSPTDSWNLDRKTAARNQLSQFTHRNREFRWISSKG